MDIRTAAKAVSTCPVCRAVKNPMTMLATVQRDWFSNMRRDFLAGLVVALALIPEAIGFSVIAGVDPKIGLYASVVIAIVIAFTGGRPAMISSATTASSISSPPPS